MFEVPAFVQHGLPPLLFHHPREWALLPFKAKFTRTVIHHLLFVRSLTIPTIPPLTYVCKPSLSCAHFSINTFLLLLKETEPLIQLLPLRLCLLSSPHSQTSWELWNLSPSLLSLFASLPLTLFWLPGSSELSEGHQRLGTPPISPHPSRPIINPLHFPPNSSRLHLHCYPCLISCPAGTDCGCCFLPSSPCSPPSQQAGSHNANLPSSPPSP